MLVHFTKYDWAFFHLPKEKVNLYPGFDQFAINRFYAYVQAGIPIICSPYTPFVERLVKQYGIGISIPDEEIVNLRSHLENFPMDGLEQAFKLAQEELAFDHQTLHKLVFG